MRQQQNKEKSVFMAWRKEYERWMAQPSLDKRLKEELEAADDLQDRFCQELTFGTGGLRGIMGAGRNRMNIYTVRKATQGLANYLRKTDRPMQVAIAYDSRRYSDVFAKETACVLAANGIAAWLYPRLQPTPALSWAVRYLKCDAGICITASHNPAEYNGYKVYGPDGGQITLEDADKILSEISRVDCFSDVKTTEFETALEKKQIQYIPEACIDAFVDTVYDQRVGSNESLKKLKLVYTPLHGTGLECVKKLLKKLNITQVSIVPEQEYPDENFTTCPYPNPEIPEAMQKGLELCERVRPDILLGTDPDCDRCGAAVPDGEGRYRLLTGNEIGIILLDYICRVRMANGTMPKRPVAVTTIVSTDMAVSIAERYEVKLRRTLTGFKFIGEQIGALEKAGEEDRFIFGFEESYGYLSGSHVRDKDGVNAVLLLCEAAAWHAARGQTLLEALNTLYEEFGVYRNVLRTKEFCGPDGMAAMQRLMDRLRSEPPQTMGGFTVEKMLDYTKEGTGVPKANVLEFRLSDNAKIIIRPSGTEPKIKLYLSACNRSVAQADATMKELLSIIDMLLLKKLFR